MVEMDVGLDPDQAAGAIREGAVGLKPDLQSPTYSPEALAKRRRRAPSTGMVVATTV
jgi:hypothetical protein